MTEIMHVDKQNVDENSETSASEALSSDSDVADEDYSADSESENENEDSEKEIQEEKTEGKHQGLADVMSKILSKNVPKHKKIILLKAKTEKELQKLRKTKRGNNSDDEIEYKDVLEKMEKKKLWENMGRIKPHPLDKDRERYLQRIATRGVVQLFNAVQRQQKLLGDKLVEAGASVRKQDKVMESMTKGKFLDLLKGTSASTSVIKVEQEEIKEEPVETEENDKWSILRDDFMMGANMKDWDKDNSGDEGGGGQEDMDDDDIDNMSDSE
ncbi:RRP15-like protein [Gigantopelta aegis]|uniref:RRP15-like protein n=1 Tax=Gigantopelta aegis TaxID=1735272 RepID=UPI001B887AC0|nr:RRP15-like protein [Gigantopelta aegis]